MASADVVGAGADVPAAAVVEAPTVKDHTKAVYVPVKQDYPGLQKVSFKIF